MGPQLRFHRAITRDAPFQRRIPSSFHGEIIVIACARVNVQMKIILN
jgi:hypothetical protein